MNEIKKNLCVLSAFAVNIFNRKDAKDAKKFYVALLSHRGDTVMGNDVAPYAVVDGNPAREIKKRFSDEEIAKLLEMQWWNWDPEKITEQVNRLTGREIDAGW